MNGKFHSLQTRLLSLMLGLVIAMWLVTAALIWWDTRQQLDELLDSHLAQAAALLVVQQTVEMGDGDHEVDVPTLHPDTRKVAFQVFHEGQLTLHSANAPAQPMTNKSSAFISEGFENFERDGKAWRVFATYGSEHDVQVYVGEALDSRSSIVWAMLFNTLWPMLLALPVLTLAIWWAVHRGTAPLRRLSQILAKRQPHDLQAVSLDGSPIEIVPTVQALNDLLARIATLMDTERRFTADAAHELRTPIAAIRTQVQVALAESNEELRQHALHQTVEGCDRAARLVEQLLTLSRLESGHMMATSTFEFFPLVRRVLAELAPKALQKYQELSLDASLPCKTLGNDTLLAVLVRNLVDNAIRYSPIGATIQVTLETEAHCTVLRVCDSGSGLSAPDIAKLGARFFRVPGNEQSGSGLGWSIAYRIAAVHHGSLEAARCETLGGLSVIFRLPSTSEFAHES